MSHVPIVPFVFVAIYQVLCENSMLVYCAYVTFAFCFVAHAKNERLRVAHELGFCQKQSLRFLARVFIDVVTELSELTLWKTFMQIMVAYRFLVFFPCKNIQQILKFSFRGPCIDIFVKIKTLCHLLSYMP